MKNTALRLYWLASLVVAVLAIVAMGGCENPLVAQMRDQIEDDVQTFLAGAKPAVVSVSPSADAFSVSTSTSIVVTFDRLLDPDSVSTDSVGLVRVSGEVDVPGTVAYDSDSFALTFTPDTRLEVSQAYRLTVTTAVSGADGATLAAAFVSEFTCRNFHDDEIALELSYSSVSFDLTASAPMIVGIMSVPYPETPVPPEDYLTELTSSPIVAESTIRIPQSAIPQGASEAVVYLYHDINNNGTFDGSPDTRRYVRTDVTGNMDDGSALLEEPPYTGGFANFYPGFVLSIGTSYAVSYAEGAQPNVTSASPTSGETSVSTSAIPTVEFDLGIDPATVTSGNVQLLEMPGETPVATTLDYSNITRTITITPSATLDVDTTYQIRVTTGVTSTEGIGIPSTFTSEFTTRYFDDDEIGLMLDYDTEIFTTLDASAPIVVFVATVPMPYPFDPPEDYMVYLDGSPVTAEGAVRIPQSDIPQETATAVVGLYQDFDNSGGEPDGDETMLYVVIGGTGNMGDESMVFDGPPTGGFMNFYPDAILTVGNGYDVTYVQRSPYSPDDFEDGDDLGPASSCELAQGFDETQRNIDVPDDVDTFRFTPATTDMYELHVMETDYEISINLYDNVTDATNETNSIHLSQSTGANERILNPGGTLMTGGQEYYLKARSLGAGIGPYQLGYRFAVVAPDANEDTDDVKTGATPLPLDSLSSLTATLDSDDSDWYEIELETATTFMLSVQEDPTYFDPLAEERGIELGFRIERAGSTDSVNIYWEIDETTLFIGDPDGWSSTPGDDGTGTYYVQVHNETPWINGVRPTAQYTISFSYGPDTNDQLDNPGTPATNEYDLFNEHGPALYDAAAYLDLGTAGTVRTIYTVEPGKNPEEDEDWFSFTWPTDAFDRFMVVVEPYGTTDDISVLFSVYPNMISGTDYVPDTSSATVGQPWDSDDTIRSNTVYPYGARTYVDPANPTAVEQRWWIKVYRHPSYPGNPLTGRYQIRVLAAADDLDRNYPDSEISMRDTGGTVFYTAGVDETPYMGIAYQDQGYPDYSDENMLTWTGSAGSYDIGPLYHSIFRRDYASIIGEPDGSTDPSTDHEFYWFQLPTDATSFTIHCTSRSKPEIPLKVTYWEITEAEFTALVASDEGELISEAELDATTTAVVVDSEWITMYQEEQLEYVVTPGDVDHYFFFKIERDDDRATYTDQYGTVWDYAPTGIYRLAFYD